ncbi:hypothetical protein, partial [Xanthomonas fragariae]|uniref:hypothetical protein n=1 Tax=Xanthomonas fragariae TaxID=48664 RepID=UPI00131F1711
MAQAARGKSGEQTMHMVRGWLTLPLALLIGIAIGMGVVSALLIEIQSGATAWIVGQSHWSTAQVTLHP